MGVDKNMRETIGQIIGFISMAIIIASYQQKSHKKILTYQMISGSLFTVHYILLGAYTGAVMNLLGAMRSLVYANRDKKWASSVLWPITFSILFAISGVLTWANAYSVFPMIAMLLSSVVLWIQNPKINRSLSIPSSCCWLIYNIKNLSYPGIATEIFVLISIIVGIIRLDINREKK